MTLKSFLLPSAKVAAARRKKTFGTESKAVAGVAIGAAAAGAIIAGPAALGAAAKKGVTSIGKAIGTYAAKKPLQTAVISAVAVPALISSKQLRKDVTIGAVNTAKELPKIGIGLGDAYSQFRLGDKAGAKETLQKTITENKTGSTVLGVGLLATSAAGMYYTGKTIIDAFGNKVDNEKEYNKFMESKINDVIDKTSKTKNDYGASSPPVGDAIGNPIPESKLTQTPGASSSSQQTPNSPGAYNIQQNNYYSEKYIKKLMCKA